MPPRHRLVNTNTFVIGIPMLVGLIAILRAVWPLAMIPDSVDSLSKGVVSMRIDVDKLGIGQAIQTDALQRLTQIAADAQSTQRSVDNNSIEIREIKRRLDKLESSP